MTEIFHRKIDFQATEHFMANLAAQLSPEKKEVYHSLRIKEDRLRLITGDRLLREVLAAKCGKDPMEIRFIYGVHGKPAMCEDESGFFFNLSHSGMYVAAAVSDKNVGIDIEQIKPLRDFISVAEVFMSELEYTYFKTLSGNQLSLYFYRLWSAKESFIKNTGNGIFEGLQSVSIDFSAEPIRVYKNGKHLPEYLFKEIFIDPDYAGFVCIRENPG